MARMREKSVFEMASKFAKLDKFEGQDFKRWQKKMHFMLTSLTVAFVISTPCLAVPPNVPEVVDGETEEQVASRAAIIVLHQKFGKWENDDY